MKIHRIVLSMLFLTQLCYGDAALQYGGATTDRSDCGSAASLDNMTRFTYMIWFRPTTLTQGRGLIIKPLDGSTDGILLVLGFTNSELTLQVNMSVTNLFMDTTNAAISVNKWHYVGFSYDVNRGAPFSQLYIGTSTNPVRLVTTDNAFPGSGTRADDSAQNLIIGNGNPGFSLAFQGQIGAVHITSAALSGAQIEDQRLGFYPTTNTVLLVNNGFSGTTTEQDWSGRGNTCTVTGALRTNIGPPAGFNPGGPY